VDVIHALSMEELHYVATPELKCLFAMVNRIKYTLVADIVDYFANVSKITGPIECTSLVTRIAMNLGYSDLAYIEGDVSVVGLDHLVHVHILHEERDYWSTILFMCTSCTRNQITLYPCCMVVRRSSYLTRPSDYILVKVLHCSLIGWERHTIASQDRLTLAGDLIWRQHNRP
jgi:hypothetical protein